jgi:hypothetical protein
MPTTGSTLIKAAAQTRGDRRKLPDADVCTSIGEIGTADTISKSYVTRVLRLALLAPEIVDRILAGKADQALMLERLERPLPANWDEQCIGFVDDDGQFKSDVHC